MRHFSTLLTFVFVTLLPISAQADRLKDLVSVAGVRSNPLVGYGMVVGLAGSGDGNSGLTRQSMQSIISRLQQAMLTRDATQQAYVKITQKSLFDYLR